MRQALMVIDVQQALMEELPLNSRQLIENLQALLNYMRTTNQLVIFVRHNESTGDSLATGSPGWEIYHAIKPLQDEVIIDKHFNSAFYQTTLHDYLQKQGITDLIVTGMQSEYCVDATIKSAFDLGYRLQVISDANSTFDNSLLTAVQLHSLYNERIWPGSFGQVITTQELLSNR